MRLIMLQGPPGSGKSTFADEICTKFKSFYRVNKDDIRLELLSIPKGGTRRPPRHSETDVILPEQDRRIRALLAAGQSVIVDDTNLNPKHLDRLKKIAAEYGADFEIKRFDTPLEECLRRNAARPERERVPDKVVRQMYAQMHPPQIPTFAPYVPVGTLQPAIIVDLDGTLALSQGCGPNGENLRNIFDGSKCADDLLNPSVAAAILLVQNANHALVITNTLLDTPLGEIVSAFRSTEEIAAARLAQPVQIVFVSGRQEQWRDQTEEFLERNGMNVGPLFMRKTGDSRTDWIVKLEIFDEHIRNKYAVLFTLDDRDQVVNAFRSIGVSVFQVAPGAF